jgi:hypothetical protein
MIFTQYLDWQPGWRSSCSVEFGQPSFACRHLQIPLMRGAPTPHFKTPTRFFSVPTR